MLTFRAEAHLNISTVPPSSASFAEISVTSTSAARTPTAACRRPV